MHSHSLEMPPMDHTWMVVLMIWDIVWRGFALWRSAKSGHRYWFIALLIVNSAGVLPILYLTIYRRSYVSQKI